MRVQFLKSAAEESGWPPVELVEVAIAGRSNAGKSSFINALTNSKAAKTSSQPGKTRLLNFFQLGEHYRLVDMPGYGFAKVSANEQKSWAKMIERYLHNRSNLIGLLLIMDIRRKWTEDEQMVVDWCQQSDTPIIVLLNKSDKVNQGEKVKKRREIAKVEGVDKVFVVSSSKRKGVAEAEQYFFTHWVGVKKNGVQE